MIVSPPEGYPVNDGFLLSIGRKSLKILSEKATRFKKAKGSGSDEKAKEYPLDSGLFSVKVLLKQGSGSGGKYADERF